ncbi:MAG: hypothetical protein D6726_06965 [Nitrospirae bacterium]|nr:MAG: hypothetical protein D6726_06965 [Nitrospirota bacterium]
MVYGIIIRNRKKGGDAEWHIEGLLPGVIPEKALSNTHESVAEKLGLCKDCSGTLSHVIDFATGKRYCPILFHDVVKPKWKIKDANV